MQKNSWVQQQPDLGRPRAAATAPLGYRKIHGDTTAGGAVVGGGVGGVVGVGVGVGAHKYETRIDTEDISSVELSSDSPEVKGHGCAAMLVPLVSLSALGFELIKPRGPLVKNVLRKLDSGFTPPTWVYYMAGFELVMKSVFALYQVILPRVRNSRLVQRKLPSPWITAQVCLGVCGILFVKEFVFIAAGLLAMVWMLQLAACLLTIQEFHENRGDAYKFIDYLCIEIPLLLMFGWTTSLLGEMLNVVSVKIQLDGMVSDKLGNRLQFASILASFLFLTGTSVISTMTKTSRGPWLHIPVAIFLSGLGWRMYFNRGPSVERIGALTWLSPALMRAIAFTAWSCAGVVMLCLGVGAFSCLVGHPCWNGLAKNRRSAKTWKLPRHVNEMQTS